MSGHSKWSTIKRKKGALDARKGKIFSRLVKEIQIAAKEGGPDPETNPKLRLAIQNARGENMPKDNIERAINKSKESADLQEVTFEGYGPNGVAIFVECLTDNNQRTVGMVRSVFNKKGGNMGTNGSLSFIFDRKGVFNVKKGNINREEFELEVIDAGIEDIAEEEEMYVLTCPLEAFGDVQKKLDELEVEVENASLQRIPNSTTPLSVPEAQKILKMIEDFEELDDVQNVFHNLEMTDELMMALNE
ncbi:MAG: YebC/PmpR family DNA-binding transcriptional regulator [Bacteroidetes bacterium]|jgi:YebC/PmpR family DNA-binding regulatory protein|nr:YebC/PmpR family DNA-binding transcriptional regulator [Bacteroidota bacterium]